MRAYYNEIDPYCAEWLKNLIGAGLIADGDVDTRSIADVTPNDVKSYTQCHFFAGLGGWSGALRRAAWSDHRPVWTGSCPCQPFSLAGSCRGFGDERHLWPHWQYLIAQCRPPVVLGEQVASASQWLRLVRGDLEALGYAVGAIPVEAASAGADHLRDRYWFVGHHQGERRGEGWPEYEFQGWRNAVASTSSICMADAYGTGPQGRQLLPECASERPIGQDGLANTDSERLKGRPQQYGNEIKYQQQASFGNDAVRSDLEWVIGADGKARRVKSGIRLLADGVPCRVAKLRALGNAIDLRPAAAFVKAVSASL